MQPRGYRRGDDQQDDRIDIRIQVPTRLADDEPDPRVTGTRHFHARPTPMGPPAGAVQLAAVLLAAAGVVLARILGWW